MPLPRTFHWLKHGGLWLYKLTTFAVLATGFGFAAIVLSLRYYFLPQIDRYRPDIEAVVSSSLGVPVAVAHISANWAGLRPHLTLDDVQLKDREGRTALTLGEVHTILSWRSLLLGHPVFHALEIDRPMLLLRRDANEIVWIAGLPINETGAGGGGFADSLLRHRQIIVRGATITWRDEKIGAPDLRLSDVDFRLDSRGRRHRFGLRAVPDRALAAPVALRGDLRGDRISEPETWDGELFAQVNDADLAQLRQWMPSLPVSRGAGAVRVWVDVKDGEVADTTGDVRLAGVLARLEASLPELDLDYVRGRLHWRRLLSGFEASAQQLAYATPAGASSRPLDFYLKHVPAGPKEHGRWEWKANTIDIAAVAAIADRLPLDDEVRREIVAVDPQGRLDDVEFAWVGPFDQPIGYRVRARFEDLGANPGPHWPGVSGLDGSIEATEQSGTLQLRTRDAFLDLPTAFPVPLAFDSIDAHTNWSIGRTGTSVRLVSLSFANADIAGSFAGSFERRPNAEAAIDVGGALTRLNPKFVGRYLPLAIGAHAREWLDQAFLGGTLTDTNVRARGNLAQFPWADGKSGEFYVTGKLNDLDIHFSPHWPPIENVRGTLSFRGAGMEVHATTASTGGIPLTKVRGVIRDLFHGEERLDIAGEAAGSTAQFLDYIGTTPVSGMIGNFDRDVRAQGLGKLAIRLDVPLRHAVETKVAGSYQFLSNQIVYDPAFPPAEQVNATLEFTEHGMRVKNGAAVAFGGPVQVNVDTPGGAVRLDLSGRANVDTARTQTNLYWLQYFHGTADWKGTITLRKGLGDYLIESDLRGVASNLPAPLSKAAPDVVPARFTRTGLTPNEDRIEIDYGGEVVAHIQRYRGSDGTLAPDRGVIALGVTPVLPESGLSLAGSTKWIDVDRWLKVAEQLPSGSGSMRLTAIDLKADVAKVALRRFSDLRMHAAERGGAWRGSVTGPEIAGDFSYTVAGNGKLTARLARLWLPAAETTPSEAAARTEPDDAGNPPDLDVAAESFHLGNIDFGRLDLAADLVGRDWKIDKLNFANQDATLKMNGVWQSWQVNPRTRLSVDLDVVDAGRFLKRMGYPEAIRGGASKLTGELSWQGRPRDLDLATLAGGLKLESRKGQFEKLDPGVAKLLGIISLQSLARRVTFDFRDIVGTGLAFDSITSDVRIADGVATTEDFLIQGPAARINMTGDVNLSAETQNLRVRVVPYLGEGVAIGAAVVGGPIAGVAALVAQKVLQDPIGQLMAFEYAVTGTWADPQVSKINKLAPPQESPPG